MSLSYWLLIILGVLMSSLGSVFLKLGAVRISHESGVLHAGGYDISCIRY